MEDFNRVAMEENCLAVGNNKNDITIGYNTAVLMGIDTKVKGKKGSWVCLIDKDKDRKIINIISFEIDGKKYKEDTYYWLQNGKIVEYKEHNTE